MQALGCRGDVQEEVDDSVGLGGIHEVDRNLH
jgi:hypothetical protein